MRWIALLALAALAALGAGCGDDDANGNQGTAPQADEAMKEKASGDAMKDESGGAMKDESGSGDAMKDEGKSGDAMEASASASAKKGKGKKKGKTIKVVGSEYGRVLADGRGEAFYLFDKEQTNKSQCFGACARAWPPVLTKSRPRAGKGAKGKLLGTTRRPNGKRQVTYAGRPLYYYVDDSPGTILCQDVEEFGGLWLVVKPSGQPVT